MWVDDNSEAAATTTQPFIFAKLDYILISSVWGRDTLAKLGFQSSPLTVYPFADVALHLSKLYTTNACQEKTKPGLKIPTHDLTRYLYFPPNVFVLEVYSCSGRFIPIIVNEVKCAKDNMD